MLFNRRTVGENPAPARAWWGATPTACLAIWLGVGGCHGGGDVAEKRELKTDTMPGVTDGIERRALRVEPFTVSPLVRLDPAIELPRDEIASIVTENVRAQMINSPQFEVVETGQPARYTIRGKIDRLSVGPELSRAVKGTSAIPNTGSGNGREFIKYRTTECFLTVTLFDAVTGKALCNENGGSKMDITLIREQEGAVTSDRGSGSTSTSISGNRFDQQQLSEVFYIAANQAAVKLSNQAIKLVFQPELKANATKQTEVEVGGRDAVKR